MIKKLLYKIIYPNRSEEENKIFQGRAPRVRILPLQNVQFRLDLPQKVASVPVANLSSSGIGFIRSTNTSWAESERKFTGTLFIEGNEFTVTGVVCHSNSQVIGCKFLGEMQDVKQAISKYLDVEVVSVGLDKIAEDKMKKPEEGESVWFVDNMNNELFINFERSTIYHFHMSFLGNYLDYKRGSGLRFGYLVANQSQQKLGRKVEGPVRFVDHIPPEIYLLIRRFITGVKELDADLASQILDLVTMELKKSGSLI